MRTLQVIYLEGKQRLQKAGNESPAFDVICLFEHVFHMNRQDLMLHGNTKQATLEQETEFFSLIEQRAKKRPLQYILGEWPFLDFHLKMGEGVLIAREDTTVLVETATKLIQTKSNFRFMCGYRCCWIGNSLLTFHSKCHLCGKICTCFCIFAAKHCIV